MAEELFRSANLLIRKVGGHGDACCVVSFDSFTDFRGVDRLGFGEFFFNAAGIDAIHVIPDDNVWYQYPEMLEAMAVVHAATRAYRRVVAYGSSMGGYAAIRLAGLAGADAVLAISPQYSIDPAVVPWETRWGECSKRFRTVWERTLPFPQVREAYVVYDPKDLDRRHAALLDARFRYQKVCVPGAGHPVTGYLAEIDLLQESAVAICRGTLSAAAFAEQARARRSRSAQYLLMLSKSTAPWRRGKRLALMHEAVRIAPGNPGILSGFAVVLGQARRFEEALAMHRRALELAPGHPNLLQNYSLSLEASGDLAGALAVMEELHVQTGGSPIYRPRLRRMRRLVARRAARAARWEFVLRRLALSRRAPEAGQDRQASTPAAERELLR